MKKSLASLALAGILTLSAGTVAAQAAPSYPSEQTATVSDSTVVPGQEIIFSGGGMTPGEIIDITANRTSPVAGGAIGSLGGGVSASVPMIIRSEVIVSFKTTASETGTFSVPVTLKETGTYTLTARGRTSKVSVSQVVKVVTAVDAAVGSGKGNNVAGAGKGGLANTGVDAGVVVWSIVGAGALAAGATTVVVSRRRNRQGA